jgi:hypothetical protein
LPSLLTAAMGHAPAMQVPRIAERKAQAPAQPIRWPVPAVKLRTDVAYLAAWCMVKTRRALEAQYAHLPQDHSPVTCPLVPADMARTPVPLHPPAARAHAELDGEPLTGPPIWS